MTPNDQRLEQIIHQTLRGLPPRSAPRSLEARVLKQISARENRSWWRQPFVHWPVAARAGFGLLGAGAVVAIVIAGSGRSMDLSAARPVVTALAEVREALLVVSDLVTSLLGAIPPIWLYSVIGFIGVLYAALFGLGLTAYRTLVLNR